MLSGRCRRGAKEQAQRQRSRERGRGRAVQEERSTPDTKGGIHPSTATVTDTPIKAVRLATRVTPRGDRSETPAAVRTYRAATPPQRYPAVPHERVERAVRCRLAARSGAGVPCGRGLQILPHAHLFRYEYVSTRGRQRFVGLHPGGCGVGVRQGTAIGWQVDRALAFFSTAGSVCLADSHPY
jgi:hypothetical protein